MADSVFLDEVVGFLHNIDDPTISGADLLQSLDKEESLISFSDTDIALQLLDVSPIEGLFSSSDDENRYHHSAATDSDCTSVETESVASSTSPQPTEVGENIRSRDAIRRSTYRQKQKAQKADLYKQVEELSTQLSVLQSRKESAKNRRSLALAPAAVWKALANRHLQARLVAEEQHRRLHEAVERRSALIKDLGGIIRKRISAEQYDGDHLHSPSKRSRVESPDMALYKTFLKELDEVYARTDNVFREVKMEVSPDNDCDSNLSRVATRNSNFRELMGKSTTPFPFERVRLLVGQIGCMENRTGREKIQVPGVSDDTSILKYQIEARVGNAVGSLVQHAITRRYYETDRIVIVWRKFTEGEGVYAGMHADETGWNVIRSAPNCLDGAGTIMESIIRYVPMSFSSVATAGDKLKEFSDTIIAAGEEDCQKCVRKLEALLLDDALAHCAIQYMAFLDDVMGLLHHMDNAAVSCNELIQCLDNHASNQRAATALQSPALNTADLDGLLDYDEGHHTVATDSCCASMGPRSVTSSFSPLQTIAESDNDRSRDAPSYSTYRQKQKAQKEILYKQVAELSTHLTTLTKRKGDAKAREGMGWDQAAVWKALASRNRQARLNAEEQRAKLLVAIEKRSGLIRDLGELIRKRISDEPLGDAGYSAKRSRTETPERAMYEVYINELDEIFAKTDDIFKETAVQTDLKDCEDTRHHYNPPRSSNRDATYHELVGFFPTPFAYDRVREHLHKVCCGQSRPGFELVVEPWIPDDTTITKCRVEGPQGISLVQHCVMRRFNESGRIVLVWRKFNEGAGMFAGMHSDETGWSIVRPSPSFEDTSVGTVLEMVARFVPIWFSTAITSGTVLQQFADLLVKDNGDICQLAIQKLEEMLLNDALGVC